MPRFFVDTIQAGQVRIEGEDARHIARSLRMQTGEELIVCDGRGIDYRCCLTEIGDEVLAEILESYPTRSEPRIELILYQALPKSDKLDWIVQKAVELGVTAVVPVLTQRCVSRPDEKSMEKKRARLQKIAAEAAKQSGRGIIPQLQPLLTFREAIDAMRRSERALFCYERGGDRLSELLSERPSSVSIMIGAEGGFSPEEASSAVAHGIAPATLGSRILRCETAPLCAISVIMNIYEEL